VGVRAKPTRPSRIQPSADPPAGGGAPVRRHHRGGGLLRYLALATDYDGTLAEHGRVSRRTIAALERVRASGRRLLLVTGRLLADLAQVFPRLDLFDRVVAENGAILYRPGRREEVALAPSPPPGVAAALRARGVPFGAGRVVIETRQPHELQALECIRELGLDLAVELNRGAAMIMPAGVDKRSGVAAALAELELTFHETVGVGDAENDRVMLRACECGAAVANALDAVKSGADLVTRGDHGAGVEEIALRLVADDLGAVDPPRRRIPIGVRGGREVTLTPARARLLVTGATPDAGRFAAYTLEWLLARGYQVCLVGARGGLGAPSGLAVLGTPEQAPSVDDVASVLADPSANAVVDLLAVPIPDRPAFLARLLPRLQELRARTGRPHWIALVDAEHLLPDGRGPVQLPHDPGGLLLATAHPERLAPAARELVNAVVAHGPDAEDRVRAFLLAPGRTAPAARIARHEGEAVAWVDGRGRRTPPLFAMRPATAGPADTLAAREASDAAARGQAFRVGGPEDRVDPAPGR